MVFSFEFCAQATNRDGPRREDLQFLSRCVSSLGILLRCAVFLLAILNLRLCEVPSSLNFESQSRDSRSRSRSCWGSCVFTSPRPLFTVFTNTKSCEKQTGVRSTSLSVLHVPFPPASGCSACVCPGLCTQAGCTRRARQTDRP